VLLPQLLLLWGRAHAKSWMISGASRPKSTLLLLSSNQEDIADACANLEDRQHHDSPHVCANPNLLLHVAGDVALGLQPSDSWANHALHHSPDTVPS